MAWRTYHHTQMILGKTDTVERLEEQCTAAEIKDAQANEVLAAAQERRAELVLQMSEAKTRNKHLRLKQATLNHQLKSLGPKMVAAAKLLARLKPTIHELMTEFLKFQVSVCVCVYVCVCVCVWIGIAAAFSWPCMYE